MNEKTIFWILKWVCLTIGVISITLYGEFYNSLWRLVFLVLAIFGLVWGTMLDMDYDKL